ncbi:MAG: AgmX/PglI C-terminal domain-containing protein [Polyangiaceae bacterium]
MNRPRARRASAAVLLSLLTACGAPAPKPTVPSAQPGPVEAPIAPVVEAPLGADHVSSPIRATDASGAELRLTALHVSTVVEDPVATTELRVLVENTLESTADARLVVTLPRRARARSVAVVRGAETTALAPRRAEDARLSFEDYTAIATEPLPLTARDEGSIDALLPPLAKGERFEISITYTELLSGDPLVVKLRGLPALDVLDVKVGAAGAEKSLADVTLAGARPDADLVVPAASYRSGAADARPRAAISSRSVVLPSDSRTRSPSSRRSSSSTRAPRAAAELGRYVTALRALVRALPAELPIQVAAFDQSVESLYEGRAADFSDAVENALRARHALGAADLERAIRWAAHEASSSKGDRRLVVFTSGHAIAGDSAGLVNAVKSLDSSGIPRRDVIAPRVGRDAARVDVIARGNDGHGAVFDDDVDGETLARRLQRKSLGAIPISVVGASDVFPHEIEDGRAGDPIALVARVPSAAEKVQLTLGSARVDVPITKASSGADDLGAFLGAQKVALFGPSAGAAPRAVLADAVNGGRFAISDVPSTLSADAMSADPMNGTVGASTTPVAVDPPVEPPVTVVEPVAEPKEPEDQPSIPPGRIPADTIRRIVRINAGRFKSCYIDLLRRKPHTSGRIVTSFKIGADGVVTDAKIVTASSDIRDNETSDCVTTAFSKLSFPSPGTESITITYPLKLTTEKPPEEPAGARVAPGRATPTAPERHPADEHIDPLYRGRILGVMSKIEGGDGSGALHDAWTWVNEAPAEALGYFALGQAARATGDAITAERAFGSILALWPNRPDMARFAGEQLEQLGNDASLELAIDAYARAVEARPDEPTSYRLLAFARLRAGHPEAAFKTIQHAMEANYGVDSFVGARATLTSDLSTLGAAWLRAHPNQRREIEMGLKSSGATIDAKPSLRFVVVWEQAASASLHVRDASAAPDHLDELKTTQAHIKGAFGPDELAIRGSDRHAPYSFVLELGKMAGPMGFSMGKLEVVDHDGSGDVFFEEHPFVVVNGATRIDLGSFSGK